MKNIYILWTYYNWFEKSINLFLFIISFEFIYKIIYRFIIYLLE